MDEDDSATDIDEGFNNGVYEVEKVVGKMFDEEGKVSYKLKWKGYNEATWESKDYCNCPQLIDSYESQLARRQSSNNERSQSVQSSSPQAQQQVANRRSSGRVNGESRRTSSRLR